MIVTLSGDRGYMFVTPLRICFILFLCLSSFCQVKSYNSETEMLSLTSITYPIILIYTARVNWAAYILLTVNFFFLFLAYGLVSKNVLSVIPLPSFHLSVLEMSNVT